jgi:hypothetical protein
MSKKFALELKKSKSAAKTLTIVGLFIFLLSPGRDICHCRENSATIFFSEDQGESQ